MSRALLPLRLSEQWVAIDAPAAREVLGRMPFVALPGASAALPGVVAWQGRAVAVVDLSVLAAIGKALGRGETRERTLVVGVGETTFALPVDAVREAQLVADGEVRPVHVTDQRFASGEVELNGTVIPVLDLEALVKSLDGGLGAKGD